MPSAFARAVGVAEDDDEVDVFESCFCANEEIPELGTEVDIKNLLIE